MLKEDKEIIMITLINNLRNKTKIMLAAQKALIAADANYHAWVSELKPEGRKHSWMN
ncbi:MAG: hypothetical protein GY712_00670 [Oceanicoccus sp.]|uniref:hypothetical protein n=1 Tax=Oceanicoccus sp. TaxID=2691044 RepID=UPI002637F5E9|nr:hypothetical protein [Oceanicoccus sp.]MCP3906519.1 hypothetical protein [Oceanicoccus sp.]